MAPVPRNAGNEMIKMRKVRSFLLLPLAFLCLSGCATLKISLEDAAQRAAKKDVMNGAYKEYYRNGNRRLEIKLKDGKLSGLNEVYMKGGHLIATRNYLNGQPHGEYKDYYSDGSLHVVGMAVNGKKEGWERKYYKSGPLFEEIFFQDGIGQGEAKTYYENGKLQYQGNMKDGKFQNIKEYDQDGKLVKEIQYNPLKIIDYRKK